MTLLTVVQHATIREDYVKYVGAVYGVVWVLTILYVVILNAKLGRLERQLDEIAGLLEAGAKDA